MKKLISTALMGFALLLFFSSCNQKPTPTSPVDYKPLIGTWKVEKPAKDTPEAQFESLLTKMSFLFHADKKTEFSLGRGYYEGKVTENADKTAFIFTLEKPKYKAIIRPVAGNPKLYNMEVTGEHFKGSMKIQISKTSDKPERVAEPTTEGGKPTGKPATEEGKPATEGKTEETKPGNNGGGNNGGGGVSVGIEW